jgi:HAE1 family hydrophobic/amphiphilic exporter-1
MVVLTVVVFGYLSLQQMPVNLMPELSYPTLTVRFDYPGAAPAEIENDIVTPTEDLLRTLEGVREVESVSRVGGADILVRYQWGANLDAASQRVRERLVLVTLPDGVDPPDLLRYDPTLEPMLRIALHGESELSNIRQFVENRFSAYLEGVDGVASARVSGSGEQIVSVRVDADRATEYDVDIEQVTTALERENIAVAGGRVRDADREYIVRTLREFESIEDIRNVIVVTGERPVRLADVATVEFTERAPDSLTRINGEPSVEVEVFRESDANLVATAERLRKKLDDWKEAAELKGAAPANAKLEIMNDQSRYVRAAIEEVRNTALIGALCAIVVLFFFIRRVWPTFIIATAIPLSVVAAFAPLSWMGVSLNIMSLGGLALGIGMLVDNAIVVLEAIIRREELGDPPLTAAVEGTREVGGAVTASTLTTIAVFAPVFFLSGQAGQLFGDLAWAVIFSLLASLAFAIFFVPMLAALPAVLKERAESVEAAASNSDNGSHSDDSVERQTVWDYLATTREARDDFRSLSDKWNKASGTAKVLWVVPLAIAAVWIVARSIVFLPFELLFSLLLPWLLRTVTRPLTGDLSSLNRKENADEGPILSAYTRLLRGAIRFGFVVVTITLMLLTIAGYSSRSLGIEVLPTLRQGQLFVDATLPVGSSLRETDEWSARVAGELAEVEGIEQVSSRAGVQSDSANTEYSGTNQTTLRLELAKSDEPVELENRVAEAVRKRLADEPELTWELRRPSLFTLPASAEIYIYGSDMLALEESAEAAADKIRTLSGVESVQNYQRQGLPEIRIIPNRERLAAVGMTARDVGQRLRARVLGEVATQVRFRAVPMDVEVSMRGGVDDDNSGSVPISELEKMRLPLDSVTLAQDFQQGSAGPQLTGLRQDLDRIQSSAQSESGAQAQRAQIPLESVAQIERGVGPAEIRHVDGRRVARIDVYAAIAELGELRSDIQEALGEVSFPEGQTLVVGGQSQRFEDTRRDMLFAFAVAVFLVYVVLASRFEALIPPLVILSVVPLSLIGVIYALSFTNTPVSVLVFVGVIVMTGIVVNNAIVLVDYALQLRRRGLSAMEATVKASAARLRPIWITTLTTVLGLLPMLLAGGEGSEIRRPLGLVLASGLLACTALTLIVVPVIQHFVFNVRSTEDR